MWRKPTATGAAALAIWALGTAVAGANGWSHGWSQFPRWKTAERVPVVNLKDSGEGCPHESADGLSLFIASNRGGDPNDIWVADRASLDAPWQEPRRLEGPINESGVPDFCPTPVRGRSLMFVSARTGEELGEDFCGEGDMYMSRQSPAGGWSDPVNLGCAPLGPNTANAEFSPSLIETPYGTFLFYSTNGTTGHQDIHVSRMRSDGTFGPGKVVDALSSDAEDLMPNVREREFGGYEIVFSSNRTASRSSGEPQGAQDVYMSFAWFLPGPWSAPVNLGESVNSGSSETRATQSRDGKRLYFGRDGDIFVSERR